MAETTTILSLNFQVGEVLTAEKMNALKGNVEKVLGAIQEEATRAKAAEQALLTRFETLSGSISSGMSSLGGAITSERNRATNAEASLRTLVGQFFRGTAESLDALRGETNRGIWLYYPRMSGVTTTAAFVLVTNDSAGNTYQFQFTGSAVIGTDGQAGAYIKTRKHTASTGTWTAWLPLSAEDSEAGKKTLVAFNENFKMQAAIFEGMNVNYELTTGKENNPWSTDVSDDGEQLTLAGGQTVLKYGNIRKSTTTTTPTE